MKTRNNLTLLALTAATLLLNSTTATAQSVDSVEALKNRAVYSSPRAREVFPWLGRDPTSRRVAACPAPGPDPLTVAKSNEAVAGSPRTREQFPELARSGSASPASTGAVRTETNTGVLSSPRTREQFPALSRGTTTVTAKGGACKLMELGK